MAQRSFRSWLALAVAAVAAAILLPACWNGGPLGPLFGAKNGSNGDGGFNPGTGGGVALKAMFVGARLARDPPKVQRVAPADTTKDVSLKAAIAVQFSESMVESLVKNGLQLFAQGSTQSTPVAISFFNGDTVAVLIPQSDLIAATQYQIAVSAGLTDLQAQAIDIGKTKGTDQRFSFTTIASTGDPPFEVLFASPAQQEGNVPRGTESVITFSEPFNASLFPGGINAPGALVVKRNGQVLTLGSDYTVTTFPAAAPRGVNIQFTNIFPADATVDIVVDRSVQNADGRKTLKGGNGFTVEFKSQDAAIPNHISFPGSVQVIGKAGAVSAGTLHAFESDVFLTQDGTTPDSTTVVYFDEVQQNALLFSAGGANPTSIISDLQPQATPALLDGDVLVGAFIERRGFRSEISIVETIVKDTIGPRLKSLGPPGFDTSLFFTQVNDPVIHGETSEPCAGVQIDFDGLNVPDFTSIQFTAGQSTVSNDLFVTGTSVDGKLKDNLEGSPTFAFICADLFGNGAVNADHFLHLTVGKVGASVGFPDGTSALEVVAYAQDTFEFFTSGAVLLDAFPPEANAAHQIVKGLAANGGIVKFSDAELASIPTANVTVTVIAQRDIGGFAKILFGPSTYCGIVKPTAASPRAVIALLSPDAQVDLRSKARCSLVGTSSNSPTFSGSAFSSDILPDTPELDRVTPFIVSTTSTDNVIDLPLNQLQSFAVTETVTIGSTNLFRFTSSEPFTSEPGQASSGGLQQKTLVANFTARTQFDAGSHPELVHSIDFDDDEVSYDKTGAPGAPGPIGLRGSQADQLRELRMITRLPGFPENAALASTNTFTSTVAPDFTGSTLLPLPLLQNNAVVNGSGFEDSPLELILQPALIDPAIPVDPSILKRNVRLEMIVQDKVIFGSSVATSAYTRQRFVFDPTTASAEILSPQSIPTPSVSNSAHPPVIQWPEVTGGEGMHVFNLISVLQLETWKIYVPAGGPGTVTLQVPLLPTSLPDGLGLIDFATIGTFQAFVESFDFDPTHIYDGTTPEQYNFDPQSWWLSDLEREFLRASRSDPNFVFSTH
jgi:hypothetical protein